MERRKVIFMGSHRIALPILEFLMSSPEVDFTGIVSQPDRKSGRGQKVTPNAISQWAIEKNVPLLCPEKPDATAIEWMRQQGCDIIFVMAYGHILGKNLRALPSCGIYNFHASLLPRFRGAAPIEAAIASGVKETGVSLMEVVKEMDAGQVFDVEKISIDFSDNQQSVVDKLSKICPILLERNLSKIIDGTICGVEQEEKKVTFCRKINAEDRFLNFECSASTLVARIRALSPKPGVCLEIEGEFFKIEALKSVSFSKVEDLSYFPGEIFLHGRDVCIFCGEHSAIVLDKIQRPGGKMLKSEEFLRGYPQFLGKIAKNYPQMKPLESLVFPF